jgi:hypothetical protein
MSYKFSYENASDYAKSLLPEGFKGEVLRLSDNWLSTIPVTENPVKIMEIGAYHGANVCSLVKTYAKNKSSEIHCVDPWLDYEDYGEYKDLQKTNYSIFLNNITKMDSEDINKIYIHRELSENIMHIFDDESFDIIYIDGNHSKKFVLEDAVLSFKKLKKEGWLIFDDLQCPDVQVAIEAFVKLYDNYFIHISHYDGQLFLKKT